MAKKKTTEIEQIASDEPITDAMVAEDPVIEVQAVEATEAAKPAIYIGPSLPAGRLTRYTIFKSGEVTSNVQRLIDECKALKFLIVPVSDLAAKNKQLSDRSSLVAVKYLEVLKHFTKRS